MHNDEVKKPIDIKAHQDNCFDFIRHIAALAVLVSHHFALTGRSEPYLFGWLNLVLRQWLFFSQYQDI
ncbi:TPA: hypothetical protein MFN52_004723 [Klebsiella quasipneumoniae subsp. similipneumoniae]|nr:hypothetical protein [Klebsiella quasipneumoniae subsp. similipneumoniae]